MNPGSHQPIFVRGVSRSGGTLLVTLLDAHSKIAMSYELYGDLLRMEGASVSLDDLKVKLARRGKITGFGFRALPKNLQTFFNRLQRGGLSDESVIELLQIHQAEGLDFSSDRGRFLFVEKCARLKMETQKKSRWGLKCDDHFEKYIEIWPDAVFLNIIRDGRDVLASQLNTGSFSNSPEKLGRGWQKTHLSFRSLVQKGKVRGLEVFYEKLVLDPASEVKRICDFIGVPFEEGLLSFYSRDLTIYKSSHLSMERISSPIDATQIGRWKKELTQEQVEEFCRSAGEAMKEFGYI